MPDLTVNAVVDTFMQATSTAGMRTAIEHAAYGELMEFASANTITITTAGTYYPWTTATAGETSGGDLVTADVADAAGDNLKIGSDGAGIYLVCVSVSFGGSISAVVNVAVHKNGSIATESPRITRKLGTGGDIGAAATIGLMNLAAADEISLKFTSDGNGDSVELEDIVLTIARVS